MTESDGKRRLPRDDWETIHIRPSIDLISDEYERETNSKFLVEMVRDPEDPDAGSFLKLMEDLGYQTSETNLENPQQYGNSNWMEKVLKKVKSQDCDGAIIVFSKVIYNRKAMKDIWTKFTSKECPELKNKPKIFIFLEAPVRRSRAFVQTDASPFGSKWAAAYETPSEADLLIIQDKFDDNGVNFLSELTSSIEIYGDKEDIFTLATVSLNNPPLLICTMTRKFYFKLHERRGHHLDIHKGTYQLKNKLEEIHQEWRVGVAPSEPDGTKKTGSLFTSLKKKLSKTWKRDGRSNSNKLVERSVADQGESSKKDESGKKVSNAPSKDELDGEKNIKQVGDRTMK